MVDTLPPNKFYRVALILVVTTTTIGLQAHGQKKARLLLSQAQFQSVDATSDDSDIQSQSLLK